MSEATNTEEIKLDEEAVKSIATEAGKQMLPELEKALDAKIEEKLGADADLDVKAAAKEAATEAAEDVLAKYLKETEEIEKKAVEKANAEKAGDNPILKGIEKGHFTDKIADLDPAQRFYMAMRAMDEESGDSKLLRQLNKYALASQLQKRAEVQKEKGFRAVTKTGYANSTTAADGAVLIPDAEFITEVYDNLPAFGVAMQFADVRQTDRTSVRVLSLDSGLTFYSTAEAGVKTGAKLGFAKNEVSLQKFAVIVPATDELTDDAVIDYWNLVTRELSRAYAKKMDEIVFTDERTGGSAGTTGERAGIINLDGVRTKAIAGTNPTWGELLDLEAKLEDDLDTSNYKWFMRKEQWYRLIQTRADAVSAADSAGLFLSGSLISGWKPNINQPTTPWGTPVVYTRVLGVSTSVGSNDAFAVFGDLRNSIVYNKRGMALKMLTEATVKDSEGTDLNLATQDVSAMRAVIRLLHIVPKGNRPKFGVLGKGTVS